MENGHKTYINDPETRHFEPEYCFFTINLTGHLIGSKYKKAPPSEGLEILLSP